MQEVESEVNQPATLADDTQKLEDHPIENQLVAGSTTTLIVKEDRKKKEEEKDDDSLSVAAAFHNNDNKILAVLNESGSYYSFNGLMRKLNLHQQSLSRALRRLEELGIVEKSRAGYRLAIDVAHTIAARDPPRQKGREYTQLLQTYIPVSIKAGEIVRLLVGKWFKNLRWLGMIESETGSTLQWISDDGSFQINLRMISDYIIIETNASTEKEKLQAMAGSYTVYEQITKAIQSRLGTYLIEQHISSRNN